MCGGKEKSGHLRKMACLAAEIQEKAALFEKEVEKACAELGSDGKKKLV